MYQVFCDRLREYGMSSRLNRANWNLAFDSIMSTALWNDAGALSRRKAIGLNQNNPCWPEIVLLPRSALGISVCE